MSKESNGGCIGVFFKAIIHLGLFLMSPLFYLILYGLHIVFLQEKGFPFIALVSIVYFSIMFPPVGLIALVWLIGSAVKGANKH